MDDNKGYPHDKTDTSSGLLTRLQTWPAKRPADGPVEALSLARPEALDSSGAVRGVWCLSL